MYTLQLQAVDSREATQDELDVAGITPDQIPTNGHTPWKIMAHQAATVRALRSGNAPLIFNQALTGDGKTLAGQFPLFADGVPTLTMYPTNELARDQKRSLDSLLEKWTPPHWRSRKLAWDILNAAELDALQARMEDDSGQLHRSDALKRLLDNDLLLTNPDMFHLMMQFRYHRYGTAHDFVMADVVKRFRLFVFDEFHLFGAAQTASALTAILLALKIGNPNDRPRFMFLSATPQPLMEHLARLVDVGIEKITSGYQYGRTIPETGWRRILQAADLHLYSGKLEDWVTENLETVILPFFKAHRPGARGVIIANSVATAYRVLAILTPVCAKAGITLGINTGLTPRDERVVHVDLLVATSTVDVGVDFRVNLLIFESMDANSHIQRLGRLGRHLDDGDGHAFTHFEAHALLPPWVVEALAKQFPAESSIARETYNDTLNTPEVYPPLQHFDQYVRRWAGVQAANVLGQLGKPEIKTQYQSIVGALNAEYKKIFPNPSARFRQLVADGQHEILQEAISFRGGNPFTALVLDMMGKSQTVVSYNLLPLLLNAELVSVPLDDLYEQARRQGANVKALERTQPLAGYRLVNWLPQARPLEIYLDRQLEVTRYDTVIEQDCFRLNAPDVPEMMALNNELEGRILVALLLRNYDPEAIRRKLRLGFQLDLLKFHSADGSRGCVAFARDALLLDSVLFRFRKNKDDGPLIL